MTALVGRTLLCHSMGWKTMEAAQQLRLRAPVIRVAPLKPYSSMNTVRRMGITMRLIEDPQEVRLQARVIRRVK